MSIEQGDRQTAAYCAATMGLPFTADEINAGEADDCTLVLQFAEARLAAYRAGMERAVEIAQTDLLTLAKSLGMPASENESAGQWQRRIVAAAIKKEIENVQP